MVRYAHLKVAVLLVLSSCRYFQAQASFQVTVVNAAGEPIPDANILIEKQLLGKSNAQGLASLKLDVPLNDSLVIEVNKPNSTTFFAPFFETVQVKRGENNFFKVRATLYGVPKVAASAATAPSIASPIDSQNKILPRDTATPNVPPETLSEGSVPPNVLTSPESNETNAELSEALDTYPGSMSDVPESIDETTQSSEEESDTTEIVTVYVGSGTQQLSEASVLIGDQEQKLWLEGCTTNVRGRCTIQVPNEKTNESLDLLVRAQGYKSVSKQISLAHGKRVRIDLAKGESLEVFATQASYESKRGLEGVKVKLAQKELGETDSYGYFSRALPSQVPGNDSDTLTVTLEAPGKLPETTSNTFPVQKSISIVQNFQSLEASRPRLLLLPLSQSGGDPQNPHFLSLEKSLAEGLREGVLESPPFTAADMESVTPLLSKLGRTPQALSRDGWLGTELDAEVEFILRPHLIQGPEARLEVALIDSKGQIRGASQIRLGSNPNPRSLRPLLKKLSQEISLHVPFEGAIVEELKDGFYINLGKQKGHRLQEEEVLHIWGMETDKLDRQKTWGEIGLAKIVSVGEKRSRIHVEELKPRSIAKVGDTVRLVRDRGNKEPTQVFHVRDQSELKPLAQANLYSDRQWLGSSDSEGRLRIPVSLLGRRGNIELIRPGYRPLYLDLMPKNSAAGAFDLQRDLLVFKVESVPSQALVKLNGRVMGRSPLYQTIQAPQKGSLIEITYSDDYRPFQSSVAPDDEGIDYTGPRTVHLEIDIRRQAKALVGRNQIPEAIALLEGVAESHPDYLLAQHELGEIYLNQEHDPVRAATTFHRVTSRPEVANFSDKRFIGSHINEALALYTAGEKIAGTEPSTALSYWEKSAEILKQTEEQLRFVPQDRYNQALHSLYYYRALSLHKTWAVSQRHEDLVSAHGAWRSYIQNTALSSPSDRNFATLKKAEVFFRQTDDLLKGVGPTAKVEATSPDMPQTKM